LKKRGRNEEKKAERRNKDVGGHVQKKKARCGGPAKGRRVREYKLRDELEDYP